MAPARDLRERSIATRVGTRQGDYIAEHDNEPAKIGLALSGGGFRAAFFHVGVLARLAEIGLLRKVEVISTVSGGSIIGVAYYLRLKQMLEARPDQRITDDMYCELVADVEARLRTAVRKNVRSRVFLNLYQNFRMARSNYSRSDRIGDLYDRLLYKGAWGESRPRKRWGLEKQIEMRELLIEPFGEPLPFAPDERNVHRHAKVPIMLINATTLNTGHNWRFEAVRMGEPRAEDAERARLTSDVDKNERLEQGYFYYRPGKPQVPEHQRDFPLALAVAASACVPGIFQPLAISKLYEDRTVQLVDGGVQDNQGVQALFDTECTHLVVSDASQQLADAKKPSPRIPAVARRSMSISADRVRDEQLVHISSASKSFALMHLRKGLRATAVLPGRSAATVAERESERESTEFGVDPRVQQALSSVRTDLDFFSDVEAYSLATDGYRMARDELRRCELSQMAREPAPGRSPWRFDEVDLVRSPSDAHLRHLEIAKSRFFRIAHSAPGGPLSVALLALVIAIAAVFVWPLSLSLGEIEKWFDAEVTLGVVAVAVVALATVAGGYAASGLPRGPQIAVDFLTGSLFPALLAPILWMWALVNFAASPLSWLTGRVRYRQVRRRDHSESGAP